jgi:hypothetical protein
MLALRFDILVTPVVPYSRSLFSVTIKSYSLDSLEDYTLGQPALGYILELSGV